VRAEVHRSDSVMANDPGRSGTEQSNHVYDISPTPGPPRAGTSSSSVLSSTAPPFEFSAQSVARTSMEDRPLTGDEGRLGGRV
jgi:hypothetical protein